MTAASPQSEQASKAEETVPICSDGGPLPAQSDCILKPSSCNSCLSQFLWMVWVTGLIAGSFLLLDANISLYVGFVSLAFIVTALLPDGRSSPAPYFVHLALPIFAAKGVREGGVWTAINVYFLFVLLPLADAIVGKDTFKKPEDEEARRRSDEMALRLAVWLVPPMELVTLIYACYAASIYDLSFLELCGFALSIGIYTGGIAFVAGHELEHKKSRIEQAMGHACFVFNGCGNLLVDHNRCHHKLIGTDDDGSTARFGESFYAFAPRTVVQTFSNAWRVEEDRCRDRNLPRWRNANIGHLVVSALICAALCVAFGAKSAVVFLGGTFNAEFLLAVANYITHYGLERERQKDGRLEPVGYEHSWDCTSRLTNVLFFQLARHSEHHVHSTRRYQVLGTMEPGGCPEVGVLVYLCEKILVVRLLSYGQKLPVGWPTCFLMAFVPPVWRMVIHPRVLALRKGITQLNNGRTFRHGPAS